MKTKRTTDYLEMARSLRARSLGITEPPAARPVADTQTRPLTTIPAVPPELGDTRKYALIVEPRGLGELAASIAGSAEVAFDVETYPVDHTNAALDPRRCSVRVLSVAAEGGIGGVVDVTEVDPTPLLDALRKKTLVAHNGKFDLSCLKNSFGYEHDGPVYDTLVLDAVLYFANGERNRKRGWRGLAKKRVRSLRDVAREYLGEEVDKREQTSDWGRAVLSGEQVRYALRDAEILLPLKAAMMERARSLGLGRVVGIEARFLPALSYCENNGFAFDAAGWREQAVQAAASVEEARARCDALAPPPPGVAGPSATRRQWNWNSAQQVGEALELLGASLPTTERGNAKTDAAALQAVTEPAAAAELAATLLRYREAKKDASTWGLGWFDPPQRKGNRFDKPHQFVVGDRVFTSFRQVVRTGRMSSESPNLQNLPPRLRRFFVAPPGRKLVVADYKNIELVLAGVIAGEPRLLDAFRRGEDVHSNTARGMLLSDPKRGDAPVTDEEIKAFRPVAKLVAFSLLYGSGPKGLAEGLTNKVGVSTSIEEAKGLLVSFFGAYPKLKRWYELERVRAANCDDRCRTLTGRLRLLDLQYRYGKWRANPQMRLNSPVQGSAGDGIKCAVALLWERRHDCPGAPVVVNLVHDEIVVEVDAEHAETCKGWLARCMEDGMAEVAGPGVPARAEIVVADTWGVE